MAPESSVPQLSRKFSFSVCLLIVLSMTIFWLISSYSTQNVLQRQADQLGQTLAQQLATQLTELMLANDLISMNVVLGSLTNNAEIREIAVLNVDNNLVAAASGAGSGLTTIIPLPFSLSGVEADYRAPIRLADSLAGYVQLTLDLSYIETVLVNLLLFYIAATVLLLIVALVMTRSYFQYLVTFPLHTLRFALGNIRKGEIDACPEPEQDNEVSATIRQFNNTAEFLAQNTFLSQLKHRMPNESTEDLTAPGTQAVTLLCCKLANYQYLSSTLPQELMIKLLNKYYFLAGKVAQLYNGEVCFCAEGELLLNFGKSPVEEEQAFHAICSGQLILILIDAICELDGHQIAAKFKISAHCGQALSGLYSPVTQKTNNLTGTTVDLTRQICNECPDNSVLISEDCFEQAGAGTRVAAEEYIVLDEEYQIVTHLAHAPMSDYAALLQRQAQQLLLLYEG